MNGRTVAWLLVWVVVLSTSAAAHVPAFPGENVDPAHALEVPDAAKSWSFYDELGGGDARYYRVSLEAGDRLVLTAFTPVEGAFVPGVVLLSPVLEDDGEVPPSVTVPDGMGAEVIPGVRPGTATYEPFAPSADYHTVRVDRRFETATTVLVALYEPQGRGGPVGLAVGYEESFSVVEYVTVPFDLVSVRRWAGQSGLLVWGPWLLTGAVTGVVGWRRREQRNRAVRGLLLLGAALVLGTALATALQALLATVRVGPTAGLAVTGAFVVVPAVAGGWVGRLVVSDPLSLTPKVRVGLVVAGLACLATWVGFIVGPAALVVAALAGGRRVGG